MTRSRLSLSLLILACLWPAASSPSWAESRWEWDGVDRIVALGDVHGSYDKMVQLLTGTGMVDAELEWIGGTAHLVFCGDLVDRGTRDRSVLDLARKLQRQAEAAGGRVHVLLGNHEVMNLTRDLRYVSRESFAEFSPDEEKKERQRGLNGFRMSFGNESKRPDEIKGAFDERYPPGYFAHTRAFAPNGEYGAWLLEQPAVIKINSVLFLHGGLTEEVAALGLDEINRRMHTGIRDFVAGGEALAKVAPWPLDFVSILRTALQLVDDPGRRKATDPVLVAARTVVEARQGLAFAPWGPVWYRGSSVEDEKLERENVLRVLAALDAEAEMVGHTVTRTGRISSRFGGRLLRGDVGMGYGRKPLALTIEKRGFLVFDPGSSALSLPLVEPPQGEGWPQGEEEMPDHALEDFLEHARVTAARDVEIEGVAFQVLELEQRDMHLRAAFGTAQESAEQAAAAGRRARRRFQHQVAAYVLDRSIDLKMVPVTVSRTVGDRSGIVQIWMQSAVALPSLEAVGGLQALAGLEPQIARARAFSALIGSEQRMHTGKMVLPASRRVIIADNGIAFPEEGEIARYLPEGCGPVGPAFMASLRTLSRGPLASDLAELLADAQLDALLERRDALLELCASPAADWSIEKVVALTSKGMSL